MSSTARASIHIRPYRAGDEAGILDCYNSIFPTADARIPARSLEHWRWKFAANPAGRIQHVVAEHDDEGIVGGYAGIPVRIWSEGREQLAAQGVDLMVLPRWRRFGPRPGLFIHLGWRFHELYCGSTDGKVLFTYGWPVPAWRMGQRYLGYVNIRDWNFLFREAGTAGFRPRELPAELETAAVDRFGADVDRLWAELRTGTELALIRDAAYLNWRYADRPDHSYRLYECRERSSARLRGIGVSTVGGFLRPHTSFLVDWLAAADDVDATVSLLDAAERQATVDATGLLALILNPVDPRCMVFQDLGYRVRGTPYFIVLASFKYETSYYRDGWYFTMGDSDLI